MGAVDYVKKGRVAELEAEIGRLRSDLIERHRTLWLIVHSNGGYELDKAAMEDWPGDDLAVLATETEPETGNLLLAAYVVGDEQKADDK